MLLAKHFLAQSTWTPTLSIILFAGDPSSEAKSRFQGSEVPQPSSDLRTTPLAVNMTDIVSDLASHATSTMLFLRSSHSSGHHRPPRFGRASGKFAVYGILG